MPDAPKTIYNPQTGANVAVSNITPISITTPSYSYFGTAQGQAAVKAAQSSQTVQPIVGQQAGSAQVKPSYQAQPQTKTYTEAETKTYLGPGMVGAMNAGISSSTIEYLASQGLAPSDVSQKALGEYISIGKSYQSKQSTFQPKTEKTEYKTVTEWSIQGAGSQENPLITNKDAWYSPKNQVSKSDARSMVIGYEEGGKFEFAKGGQEKLSEYNPLSASIMGKMTPEQRTEFLPKMGLFEKTMGITSQAVAEVEINKAIINQIQNPKQITTPQVPETILTNKSEEFGYGYGPLMKNTSDTFFGGMEQAIRGMQIEPTAVPSGMENKMFGLEYMQKSSPPGLELGEGIKKVGIGGTRVLGGFYGVVGSTAGSLAVDVPIQVMRDFPKAVEAVRSKPAHSLVFAGEAIAVGAAVMAKSMWEKGGEAAQLNPEAIGETAFNLWAVKGMVGKGLELSLLKGGKIDINVKPEVLGEEPIRETVYRGVYLQVGAEGEARPLIGLGKRGIILGTPKAEDLPGIERMSLIERTEATRNYPSYPQNPLETRILNQPDVLKKIGFSEKDIKQADITQKALDIGLTEENPFAKKTYPDETKIMIPGETKVVLDTARARNSLFTKTMNVLTGGQYQKTDLYGSFPEQPQRAGGLARTPGDIEFAIENQRGALGLAKDTTKAEIRAGFKGFTEGENEAHPQLLKVGEKAVEYKYPGEEPEAEMGTGMRYGKLENRPYDVIQGLKRSRISEQFVRKGGASAQWSEVEGEPAIEPGAGRAKDAADFYAQILHYQQVHQTTGDIPRAEKMGALAKEYRGLEFREKEVEPLMKAVDANLEAYWSGIKTERPTVGAEPSRPTFAGASQSVLRSPLSRISSGSIGRLSKFSPSKSVSKSLSVSSSFSSSLSPSISKSISTSPSISTSVSLSKSLSVSPSFSPSISPSVSISKSPSVSRSPSFSPSISPSISISRSPSPSPSSKTSIYIPPSTPIFRNLSGSLKQIRKRKTFTLPKFKGPRGRSILQPHLTYMEKTRLELRKHAPYRITVPSTPKTRAAFIKSGLGAFGYSGLLKPFKTKRRGK